MNDILFLSNLDGLDSSNTLTFTNFLEGGTSTTEVFTGIVTGETSEQRIKNKISTLVKNQFPEYVRSEYDTFLLFVESYYKFLETDSGAQEIVQNALSYSDIDRTASSFVYYFLQNYAKDFPLYSKGDIKFLIKKIKDLYESKGSLLSFHLLFRLLFETNVEIEYPYENVLKASDGTWEQKSAIGVSIINGNRFEIENKFLVYTVNGATYSIPILATKLLNTGFVEISLDHNYLPPKFNVDDFVYVYNTLGFEIFKAQILKTPSEYIILNAGSGFKLGQIFNINSGDSIGSVVKVTDVSSTGGIKKLKFINFGYGYPTEVFVNLSTGSSSTFNKEAAISSTRGSTDSITIQKISTGSNVMLKGNVTLSTTPTVISNVMLKGNVTISTSSNIVNGFGGTEFRSNLVANNYVTIASYFYQVENVISNTQFYITTVGSTDSANVKGFVTANANVVFGFGGTEFRSNIKTGDFVTIVSNTYTVENVVSNTQFYITTVGLTNSANVKGFATDTSTIYFAENYNDAGENYSGSFGTSISFINPPSSSDYREELPQKDLPSGFAQVKFTSNALARYPGSYLTNKGFISEYGIVFEDDLLHQPYAYQLNTEIDISKFYDVVTKLIHPAGQRLFNNRTFTNLFDLSSNVSSLSAKIGALNFESYSKGKPTDTTRWMLSKTFAEEESVTASDINTFRFNLSTIEDVLDGITDSISNITIQPVVTDTTDTLSSIHSIDINTSSINDTTDSVDTGSVQISVFSGGLYNDADYFLEDYTSLFETTTIRTF